jgi:CHAT domain-containing protein
MIVAQCWENVFWCIRLSRKGVLLVITLTFPLVAQEGVDSVISVANQAERNKQYSISAGLLESLLSPSVFNTIESYSKKRYILGRLSDLYSSKLSRFTEAIRIWERAVALADTERNEADRLVFLFNIGAACTNLADYGCAEKYLLLAEQLAQSRKDTLVLREIDETLALLYIQQGDTARAQTYRNKSEVLSEKVESNLGKKDFDSLLHSASSAALDGRYERGLEFYSAALKLVKPNSKEGADILYAMADLHERTEDLEEALRLYMAAYHTYSGSTLRLALGNCAASIGGIFYQEGHLDSALAYLRLAIDVHGQVENAEALATDFYNLGLVFQSSKNSGRARDAFTRSVLLFEYTRSRVAGAQTDEERRKYLTSRLMAYEELLTTLFESHSESSMFMVMELAQARTLFEAVQKLLNKEEEKKVSLPLLKVRFESSADVLLNDIYQQAGLASLDEVRARLLGEDVALVEYFCGQERSYVLVATKEAVAMFELPRPEELALMVERYRMHLQIPAAPDLVIPECREISRRLFDPIWPIVQKKTQLYIIPSGPLWLVPFETFLAPHPTQRSVAFDSLANSLVESFRLADFLIRRMTFTYCQSASILLSMSRRGGYQARSLIAFADPLTNHSTPTFRGNRRPESELSPLPYARIEVQNIAALFPPNETSLFFGDDATEENAKKVLNQARAEIVHFATHGFLSLGIIGQIGVLLTQSGSDDGILGVNEIARLQLHARLVVLSACETGLGDQVPGEGTMGLARAFTLAGASSVIVSLWRVPDLSTSLLMKGFYAAYASNGGKVAEALQQAQLSMIRSDEYSAPYYWAPFISIGR